MERIFYDSSIAFYCAGCIGYRWAVKVAGVAAANDVDSVADSLLFQEILDRFYLRQEQGTGELVARSFRRIMHRTVPVTVQDFDHSAELFRRYPTLSPRILLRAAVMRREGVRKICSTFASGFEQMEEVERVNLMERVAPMEGIR